MLMLEDKLKKFLVLSSADELSIALENYRAETSKILSQKNQFIAKLIKDLKIEEDIYLKSLAEWSKSFEIFVLTSKQKVDGVGKTMQSSLTELEQKLILSRKNLMKANKTEIEELFKKHE